MPGNRISRGAVAAPIVVVLFLVASCGGRGAPRPPGDKTPPAAATYAKSFGGTGSEEAISLTAGADGSLSFLAFSGTDVIGGFEKLPWLVSLDPLGDAVFEQSLAIPASVADDATYEFARVIGGGDGGALFAGSVENDATGRDIFLQRLDENGTSLWTLELDSGDWNGVTQYGGTRPYARDRLRTIVGSEALGWYVVSQSVANIAITEAGGVRVFVDVPSIMVFFISPAGTEVWRTRLLASDRDQFDFGLTGPYLEAAELTFGPRLTMLVRNLDSQRIGLSLVHIDATGSISVETDTAGLPNLAGSGRFVLQTSDTVGGVLDQLADDGFLAAYEKWDSPDFSDSSIDLEVTLTKFRRDGVIDWTIDLTADEYVYVDALAQTFSAGSSVLWVGGRQDVDPDAFRLEPMLWQITPGGSVIRSCALPGNADRILNMQSTDGGSRLAVLVHTGDRMIEAIFDDQCTWVGTGRDLPAPRGMSPQRVSEQLVEDFDATGPVLSVLRWDERGFHLSILDDAGNERLLRPPESGGSVTYRSFLPQLAADVDSRTGETTVYREGTLLRIAPDGLITSSLALPYAEEHYQERLIVDASGNAWLFQDDDLQPLAGHSLVSVDSSGLLRTHLAGTESLLDGVQSDGRVYVLGESLQLFAFDPETGTATVRAEAPDVERGFVNRLDVSAGRILTLAPGVRKVSMASAEDGSGWVQELAVSIADGVVAHDGGAVLLGDVRADNVPPEGFNDPPQTRGDRDLVLIKLAPDGRPQWARIFGAAQNEYAAEIVRTPGGYGVLAESDSLDAVTPGTRDIWVLKTGPDGHIAADASGVDTCQACLGSISGQALLDFLDPDLTTNLTLYTGPVPIPFELDSEMLSSTEGAQQALASLNTARQCFGTETDVQEAPLGVSPVPVSLTVAIVTDGVAVDDGGAVGGSVTSVPAGIACADAESDCTQSFSAGTQVELTATANAGFTFEGWTSSDPGSACSAATDSILSLGLSADTQCSALFATAPAGAFEDVTVLFDQPAGRPGRVVDATNRLDCTSDCTTAMPVADSPIVLRAIEIDSTWAAWQNCDRLLEDPGGPPLCEIDIAAGARTVIVEYL